MYKNTCPPLAVALLLLMSLQSCFVFGIKAHVKHKDKADYKKIYTRNHIKHEPEYYLDTAYYGYINHLCGNNDQVLHDHLQPVQYLLFNKQGYLVSFMINCFVHTNFLLCGNWNYDHLFDTFPTRTQRPLDSLVTLQGLRPFIKDISGRPAVFDTAYDYTEVVLFGAEFYRAGKELVKTVKHEDRKGYKVKTYYVNSDNEIWWVHKQYQAQHKDDKFGISIQFGK